MGIYPVNYFSVATNDSGTELFSLNFIHKIDMNNIFNVLAASDLLFLNTEVLRSAWLTFPLFFVVRVLGIWKYILRHNFHRKRV